MLENKLQNIANRFLDYKTEEIQTIELWIEEEYGIPNDSFDVYKVGSGVTAGFLLRLDEKINMETVKDAVEDEKYLRYMDDSNAVMELERMTMVTKNPLI